MPTNAKQRYAEISENAQIYPEVIGKMYEIEEHYSGDIGVLEDIVQ